MPLLGNTHPKLYNRQEGYPHYVYPSSLPGVSSVATSSYYNTLVNTVIALAVLSAVFFTIVGCLLICIHHRRRRPKPRKQVLKAGGPVETDQPPKMLIPPESGAQSCGSPPLIPGGAALITATLGTGVRPALSSQAPPLPQQPLSAFSPSTASEGRKSAASYSRNGSQQPHRRSGIIGVGDDSRDTRSSTPQEVRQYPQLGSQTPMRPEPNGVPQSGQHSSICDTANEVPSQQPSKYATGTADEYVRHSSFPCAWSSNGQRRRPGGHRSLRKNRGQ